MRLIGTTMLLGLLSFAPTQRSAFGGQSPCTHAGRFLRDQGDLYGALRAFRKAGELPECRGGSERRRLRIEIAFALADIAKDQRYPSGPCQQALNAFDELTADPRGLPLGVDQRMRGLQKACRPQHRGLKGAQGSPADVQRAAQRGASAEPLKIDLEVRVDRENRYIPIPSGSVLRSGERFRIRVTASRLAWIYVFYRSTRGELKRIFPSHGVGSWEDAQRRNLDLPMDRDRTFMLDNNTGHEHIFVVATTRRNMGDYHAFVLPEIELADESSSAGDGPGIKPRGIVVAKRRSAKDSAPNSGNMPLEDYLVEVFGSGVEWIGFEIRHE